MLYNEQKIYYLKSFYASVECVQRDLDPLSVNLVVADSSRTEKTICLAVSPALKAYGIPGRARLFEVIQKVREINSDRLNEAIKRKLIREDENGRYDFSFSSYDAAELKADPSLELVYITAPPRMKLYEEYSTRIYSIYLKYIAPEDIHVYSIDEVFIDATRYLAAYNMSAHSLAMSMIREVFYTTGITATAGIGTNMYLAKAAMDIVAKRVPADKDGVRIAEIDEQKYRELLWCHRPLTDFWRIGRGYSRKLEAMGLFTMGDIAKASMDPYKEDLLYKAFGINAELLIDHAWGYEPTENALALDLVSKKLVTDQVILTINYDRESLTVDVPGKSIRDTVYTVAGTGKQYTGAVTSDPYGRPHPRHSHGTGNIDKYTNSARKIVDAAIELYRKITDPDLLIRRINIAACNIIPETKIPEDEPEQLDLFTNKCCSEGYEFYRGRHNDRTKRTDRRS